MPKSQSQKRKTNWVFTWNNWTPEDEEYLATVVSRCIAYSKETAPTTGTPHLQGFVVFETKKSLKQVRAIFKNQHVEMMMGNIDQNVTYCSKSSTLKVLGTLPMSRKRKGEESREMWDDVRKKARVGDFDSIPSSIWLRYDKSLIREYNRHKPKPVTIDGELTHEWHYGPTGTGKSRHVRTLYPDAYIKNADSKWWDKYQDQEVVIIEDFDKYHVAQGYHMKIWADRYPFPAEHKGGTTLIRPQKIIVTSNYHPSDIWEDERTLDPILRRFKMHHHDKL